jgi:hypothetical protein
MFKLGQNPAHGQNRALAVVCAVRRLLGSFVAAPRGDHCVEQGVTL